MLGIYVKSSFTSDSLDMPGTFSIYADYFSPVGPNAAFDNLACNDARLRQGAIGVERRGGKNWYLIMEAPFSAIGIDKPTLNEAGIRIVNESHNIDPEVDCTIWGIPLVAHSRYFGLSRMIKLLSIPTSQSRFWHSPGWMQMDLTLSLEQFGN